ncbi:MAG TPA: class I SAM-dependent methyltransferase [Candidatus Sulfotelmatobacter sp.]|nr:class I SAM-dependent methyltransferase [Candidatus Sulfotelmatobacter sp.]
MSACNLCGAGDVRILETSADGVRVVQCRKCGLIFLDPFPRYDAAAHYDEAYYRPWRDQAPQRAALWTRRAEFLRQFSPVGRLLDVGCGDGAFMLAARRQGWQVMGTEVSAWAADTLPGRDGLAVVRGELPGLELPGLFDAVTMWHVLEHVQEPGEALRAAVRLLRPGGVLTVAVPNAASHLFRLAYLLVKRRPLRYYAPGERELHLYHFTPATLRTALEGAGLSILYEGVDRSSLTLPSYLLEGIALGIHGIAGVNWAAAMVAVAARRETP